MAHDLLRVVQLNAVYDPADTAGPALLDRYTTMTGWARAVHDPTVRVSVVQRFSQDCRIERDGIEYRLRADDGTAFPAPGWSSDVLVREVAACQPDVVHVNGLMFPALCAGLRRALGPRVAIVAQDHAGGGPPQGGWRRFVTRRVWHDGFASLDACTFTHVDMAAPWIAAGLLAGERAHDVLESSTDLAAMPRAEARRATGVEGDPAIVWVGRLDRNKDPLTVLAALEQLCARRQGARLWMLYHDAPLEADVSARIRRVPSLAGRVTLAGAVPHARVAAYLSAADIFVSGSHTEGSGYALIEAMACGAIPIVTSIPSFRAIVGACGEQWPPGDAAACLAAFERILSRDLSSGHEAVRARFASTLTWTAIGRRTRALYRALASACAQRAS